MDEVLALIAKNMVTLVGIVPKHEVPRTHSLRTDTIFCNEVTPQLDP